MATVTIRRTGWAAGCVLAVAAAAAGLLGGERAAWVFLGLAILALAGSAYPGRNTSEEATIRRLQKALRRTVRTAVTEAVGAESQRLRAEAQRSNSTEPRQQPRPVAHPDAVTLDAIEQAAARGAERVARSVERSSAAPVDLSQVLEPLATNTRSLSNAIAGVRKDLEHQPYLAAELGRRYAQLIDSDQPMPVLGANWAATAPTILFIIDEVLGGSNRRTILECGSGASTLWTAAALRHRGEGHVYTLEHDKEFGETTRANLRAHGLEQWATVVDAPLVEIKVPGLAPRPWYDLANLDPDLSDVDLVFVDGPPRLTARLARYPAVPMLLPRLRSGCLVILDDTNRQGEREIVQRWSTAGTFDRQLSVVKGVGRSTVLTVE